MADPDIKAIILPPPLQCPADVEAWFTTAHDTVMGTLKAHTTQCRPSRWSKRWWNAELSELRRIYHSLSRRARWDISTQPDARRAKNTYFHTIASAKKKCWSTFLETATAQDMWCAEKYLIGKAPKRVPSFSYYDTPEDVRDVMMKGFFPLPPALPARRPTLPDTSYCTLTALEVGMALAKCWNLSAPGPDQIPYLVWKNIQRISGPLIASLLDPLLRWGIYPATLKKS